MSHQHSHSHSQQNIKVAFFLNVTFTVFEIVGGVWTNSMAIIADAVHDLGDSIALGFAWYFENLSHMKSDHKYSYGYRRFSLAGAFLTAIILLVGSLIILTESVPRLWNPEPAHAGGMLGFAIVGVLVNGVAVLRLRQDKGLNAQVVMWHLIEDVLGWVAILFTSIVLMFKPYYVLDSILSILITLYVLYNVVRRLRTTVAIFLQRVPENTDIKAVKSALREVTHIIDIHHTHAWSIDGEHHVMTTHVVVDKDISREDLLKLKAKIAQIIRDHRFVHSTVEVEFSDECCRISDSAHH